MVENDGHYLNVQVMDLMVAVYDPTGENAENPLAWPYFASEADVAGLPPHVITANELDPLRDSPGASSCCGVCSRSPADTARSPADLSIHYPGRSHRRHGPGI